MKIKVNTRKRILLASLIFSYVGGIGFGSFVHNLLHHIDDHRHHHNIPCLVLGLSEMPSDELKAFSQEATITTNVCAFKLALDSLCSPTIGLTQVKIKILSYNEFSTFLKPSTHFIKEILVSSISARGPPVRT